MIGYLVRTLYDSLGTQTGRCVSVRYDGVGRSVPYVAGSAGQDTTSGRQAGHVPSYSRNDVASRGFYAYVFLGDLGHILFGPSSAKNNEQCEVENCDCI